MPPDLSIVQESHPPGLTSSPAIGCMVADIVKEKLHPEVNPDFDPVRKGILDPSELSLEERNELIERSPEYGNIICRCEMISEGEILWRSEDLLVRNPWTE